MDKLEYKSIPLSVDDVSKDSRTAVIAHATYDNIDKVGDISRPGMFNKSWSENKAGIKFLVDHDNALKPGKVLDVWESKASAFTKVHFSNTTLGNDTMEMISDGIIEGASFGFKAIKSNRIEVKGQKVRELKEVYHAETTVTNALDPINPESRVVLLTKAMNGLATEIKALSNDEQAIIRKLIDGSHSNMESAVNFSKNLDTQSDLYTWISYYISQQASGIGDMRSRLQWGTRDYKAMKARAEKLEAFCRNSNASDECIQSIMDEAKALQHIVSQFDTANTHDDEPDASDDGSANETEVLRALQLFNLQLSMS